MPFERKTAVRNNGYPTTAYGNISTAEKAELGRSSGDAAVGQFVMEFDVAFDTVVGASEHGNLMLMRA